MLAGHRRIFSLRPKPEGVILRFLHSCNFEDFKNYLLFYPGVHVPPADHVMTPVHVWFLVPTQPFSVSNFKCWFSSLLYEERLLLRLYIITKLVLRYEIRKKLMILDFKSSVNIPSITFIEKYLF